MLALAREIKKIIDSGESIIFPDVHPDIRPGIKKMFLVEKDGKKYPVENLLQVKIPFSVLDETIHFVDPNHKYVEPFIDPSLFISLIKKRYKYVEKIVGLMV